MFELSANIEYMFTEAGETLEQRIAAAANAGIHKVEMFTLDNRNAVSIATALKDHGVQLYTMVNDPRTILANPENHQTFLDNFRKSAEFAVACGCPHVVCGSGTGLPFIKRQKSLENAASAISRAADIAEELNVNILLEAVNARVDHPGVLFSATEDSYSVANLVNSPRVKILYDLYHSIAEGEDTAEVIQLLAQNGYTGVIGIECVPTKPSTAEAIKYIQSLCA